ncbi:MAG: hypothetical protein RIR18_1895 [Pseudomonadota bacterium]
MLEIEIDGKQAQVADGSTVMDAAQQLGVYIPHFCYHKKLSIAANCRMCLVQVEKAPKPLPACATPVTNCMKVFTHSELATKAQKGVMEFLLINHPLDCPVCDQGGECQLQDMAVGYGDIKSRYQEEKRVVFHKKVGPLISMEEMSRCIHCTRCVRFGQEIAGVMELGMSSRNMHSEITTFLGRTVDSELSGNMIDLCPVGALTSKPFRYSARSWELQRRKTVSPHDSLGANLVVQVKHDKVMRVLPFENEAVNECWISDKERFSYEALNSEQRLTKPMVRQGGEWKVVPWNVALDYVAHALRDITATSGGDSLAALASPSSTVEELYLIQRLVGALGSGNIDFRPRHSDFSADDYRAGIPWLGLPVAELENQDAVLVVGSFLRKDHPLLAQRLRQAAKKYTEVSLVSVTGDDQLIKLHSQITVAPSALVTVLASIVKAAAQINAVTLPIGLPEVDVSTEAVAIAKSLVSGEKAAVLLGNVAEQSEDAAQIRLLAQFLAQVVGASLGVLGDGANSIGGYLAGATPKGANAKQMFEQPRQAYLLMGLEAESDLYDSQIALSALAEAKLVVHMGAFASDTVMKYADVLLPTSPYTETSGTFVNIEGRIQSFSGLVKPLGETRPGWKVLRVLANILNCTGFDYNSSEEVRDEVFGKDALFATGLNSTLQGLNLNVVPRTATLQRIADVPIYFTDALVRRATSLQSTHDARQPTARMNGLTLASLELLSGQMVKVKQGGGSADLLAELDDKVPSNCVLVSAAHWSTAQLGAMFGPISVERA